MIATITTDELENGKTYLTPANWSEITLKQYLAYLPVKEKEPTKLKECFESEDFNKAYLALDLRDKAAIHSHMVSVLHIMMECPKRVLLQVDREQIEVAFFAVYVVLLSAEYKRINGVFEFNGQLWYLPQENMKGSTVIEFAEAAQFEKYANDLHGGNDYALLDVISILARPKGEEYDSDKLEERKELFRGLSMDIVFGISFFLSKLNVIFQNNIIIYSQSRLLGLIQ